MRLDLERLDGELLHLNDRMAEYYICGPETFIGDMDKTLVERGVDPKRIKAEWFA